MESLRKLISRFLAKFDRGREMTVHAVITRADGTVEDLGLITKGYIKNWDAEKFIPSGGK